MKRFIQPLALFLGILLLSSNSFLGDKDPLHGRKYDTNAIEYREGAPKPGAKSFPYVLEFKNGKLFYDLAADAKGGGFDQWIKYEIVKDSVYTEEEVEKRYFEVKASKEDDDGRLLKLIIKIDETDIEGSYQVIRREKLMKHFEFNGEEKSKKKK